MTNTLPKGVYTGKSDSECSPMELHKRLEFYSELRGRMAELNKKSDEAQRRAYHDIMRIRLEPDYN